MAIVKITTDSGEFIEQFDTNTWNLVSRIGKTNFLERVYEALLLAEKLDS